MNREWGVSRIGWMSGGVGGSRQVSEGMSRGGAQMQRGRRMVEWTLRSEWEWMGEQSQASRGGIGCGNWT